jgi:K+-sensing histidine kinase KdpD
MDVSKYNSGSFSVNLSEKIDIKEIINRSIRVKKEEGLRRRIKIVNEVADKEIPLINLDSQRMKQVLVNLISNAIKYSPDNTTIIIQSKITKDNQLQIDVVDQGFGMTKEELKIAMEPFQTINNPNTGKVDCFGLGLPLVKDLVYLQKGEMKIESVKNEGTKVSLFFGC